MTGFSVWFHSAWTSYLYLRLRRKIQICMGRSGIQRKLEQMKTLNWWQTRCKSSWIRIHVFSIWFMSISVVISWPIMTREINVFKEESNTFLHLFLRTCFSISQWLSDFLMQYFRNSLASWGTIITEKFVVDTTKSITVLFWGHCCKP